MRRGIKLCYRPKSAQFTEINMTCHGCREFLREFAPSCSAHGSNFELPCSGLPFQKPILTSERFASKEAHHCDFGVNTGLISTEAAPLGGVKRSGLGCEGLHHGIEDYGDEVYLPVGLTPPTVNAPAPVLQSQGPSPPPCATPQASRRHIS